MAKEIKDIGASVQARRLQLSKRSGQTWERRPARAPFVLSDNSCQMAAM